MKLPPLNSIRAFEIAARHLSFKKAAGESFVTPAAVSYQIRILEEYLGVELFERENRKVILTPAAQRAFSYIEDGFDQIGRGVEKMLEGSGTRPFVVSSGPAFAVKWLAPRMHGFASRYPDTNVSVMASLNQANFRTDSIDAAIRFGTFDRSGLYVEKLMDESVVPMCHPQWLQEHGPFFSPSELFDENLIHDDSLAFNTEAPNWQSFAEYIGLPHVDSQKGVHFNQADHALQAALDGAGVVLGRRILATPDLDAGRLVDLFAEHEMPVGMAMYFVCLEEKAGLPENQVFRQWLLELFDALKP